MCGPLAQLVEQLTLNQLVGGSNPPRLTTHPLRKRGIKGLTPKAPCLSQPRRGPVAQLVEQLTFNQWVTGSNPVGLTIFQVFAKNRRKISTLQKRIPLHSSPTNSFTSLSRSAARVDRSPSPSVRWPAIAAICCAMPPDLMALFDKIKARAMLD